MLERLVLKNAADCTSQRLKRTSGVRVMNFFCVYLLLEADKQTSRQADKQTSRQAAKQTSTQAAKQTSRQADKQTCTRALVLVQSGPVRSGFYFFPVRVVPSGPGPIGPAPVRSGFDIFPVQVWNSGPGFKFLVSFVRSGSWHMPLPPAPYTCLLVIIVMFFI